MRSYKEFISIAEQITGATLGITRKFGSSGTGGGTSVKGSVQGGNFSASGQISRGTISGQGDKLQQGIDNAIRNYQTGSNSNTSTSTVKTGTTGSLNVNLNGKIGSAPRPTPPKPTPSPPPPKPTPRDRFGPYGSPTAYRSLNPKENEIFKQRPDIYARRVQQANLALDSGNLSARSLRRAITPTGAPFDPTSAKAYGYQTHMSGGPQLNFGQGGSIHPRDIAALEKSGVVKPGQTGVPLSQKALTKNWNSGVTPKDWK